MIPMGLKWHAEKSQKSSNGCRLQTPWLKTLTVVWAENNQLKQALNLTNYRSDSLEQYGRRENL